MCPHCQSLDWQEQRLAGTGTLYSYAVLHHPRSPAFEYPVFAALVDLDEGVRIVSNLVGTEAADIRIGMRARGRVRADQGRGHGARLPPDARRR